MNRTTPSQKHNPQLAWSLGSSVVAILWAVVIYGLEGAGSAFDFHSDLVNAFLPIWIGVSILLVGFLKSSGWGKGLPLILIGCYLAAAAFIMALFFFTMSW